MRKDDRTALAEGVPRALDCSRQAGSWESWLLSPGPLELCAFLFNGVLLKPVSPPSEKQLGKSALCPHSLSELEKQD